MVLTRRNSSNSSAITASSASNILFCWKNNLKWRNEWQSIWWNIWISYFDSGNFCSRALSNRRIGLSLMRVVSQSISWQWSPRFRKEQSIILFTNYHKFFRLSQVLILFKNGLVPFWAFDPLSVGVLPLFQCFQFNQIAPKCLKIRLEICLTCFYFDFQFIFRSILGLIF